MKSKKVIIIESVKELRDLFDWYDELKLENIHRARIISRIFFHMTESYGIIGSAKGTKKVI